MQELNAKKLKNFFLASVVDGKFLERQILLLGGQLQTLMIPG